MRKTRPSLFMSGFTRLGKFRMMNCLYKVNPYCYYYYYLSMTLSFGFVWTLSFIWFVNWHRIMSLFKFGDLNSDPKTIDYYRYMIFGLGAQG